MIVFLVFRLYFKTSLYSGLYLEALLFEVFDLLYKYRVLLGQCEVCVLHLLVVCPMSVDFIVELDHLPRQFVLLMLAPDVCLNLDLVVLAEGLQLGLQWSELEKLTLEVEPLPFDALKLPLLLSELV